MSQVRKRPVALPLEVIFDDLPFGDLVSVVGRMPAQKALSGGSPVNRLRPYVALVLAAGGWGAEITVAKYAEERARRIHRSPY